MSLKPPATDGNEQLAMLVAKYRVRQKRRLARPNPNAETLEEFGQRVFGTEAGQEVLLEYMREHAPWLLEEEDDGNAAVNGR